MRPFFFVSGFHDKNFPWGDEELFWDALLVIGDCGRGYKRHCIADRILPELELDVAAGTYRYRGPIFAVDDGVSSSWSRMKSSTGDSAKLRAEIEAGCPKSSDFELNLT